MLIYRKSITLLGIVLLIYEISFKNTIKMAEKSKTNKYPIILTEKLDSYKYRQKIKMLLIKKNENYIKRTLKYKLVMLNLLFLCILCQKTFLYIKNLLKL